MGHPYLPVIYSITDTCKHGPLGTHADTSAITPKHPQCTHTDDTADTPRGSSHFRYPRNVLNLEKLILLNCQFQEYLPRKSVAVYHSYKPKVAVPCLHQVCQATFDITPRRTDRLTKLHPPSLLTHREMKA